MKGTAAQNGHLFDCVVCAVQVYSRRRRDVNLHVIWSAAEVVFLRSPVVRRRCETAAFVVGIVWCCSRDVHVGLADRTLRFVIHARVCHTSALHEGLRLHQ